MPDPRFLLTLPGVPRRGLSRLSGRLAGLRVPLSWRRRLWPRVARSLGIPREEVPGRWEDYASLLALFTRPLVEGSRPLPDGPCLLSPADGVLVEDRPLCAEGSWSLKGTPYRHDELFPGIPARELAGYRALQIYLSPRDYHRVHAPCTLRIHGAWSEPGDLQPVDPSLVRRSWRVLATNRRVLLQARGPDGAWFGLLLVGALNVGRMRFVFDPSLGSPPMLRGARRYDPPPEVAAGEELGRFELGSTVLFLVPPGWRPVVGLGERCQVRRALLLPIGAAER